MAQKFTTKDLPHWQEMLILLGGELIFFVVALPFYILFVLPRFPQNTLYAFVPPIAESAHPVLAILAGLATCAAGVGLVLLLLKVFGFEHFRFPEIEELIDTTSNSELALLYLAAGIGEEMLFRVVLQTLFGILPAAILFAATHIAYWKKPMVMLDVFVLALMLGALFAYTQSFWICAAVHAVYNFTVTILYKKRIVMLDQPARG